MFNRLASLSPVLPHKGLAHLTFGARTAFPPAGIKHAEASPRPAKKPVQGNREMLQLRARECVYISSLSK